MVSGKMKKSEISLISKMDKNDKIIIVTIVITIIVLLLSFFIFDWINSYNVFLKAINDGDLQKVKNLPKVSHS